MGEPPINTVQIKVHRGRSGGGVGKNVTHKIPLIPCKRRESVFTWVYIGSNKKKNFDIDFPTKLGNFKTLLFFHQKFFFSSSDETFKKSQKMQFFPVQAYTMKF